MGEHARRGAGAGGESGAAVRVVLIGTYELGRQSFGLASAAAWLQSAGASVGLQDLAVQALDEGAVRAADLVAFYLPMHTAARLALPVAERVRELNPTAHLCFFGLYAPLNEGLLRGLGAGSILGAEFEEQLVALARRLALGSEAPAPQQEVGGRPPAAPPRQRFLVPVREGLPDLSRYAYLDLGDGERRTVGYTEATRGCKHLCRHCPVVPVYGGALRVVQAEAVLEDIARQVAAGARHITFGDPDFFNGPGHALRIVRALHARWPDLTYDATIKIEHLLKEQHRLSALRETGCLFVTCAVEALDDATLALLEKGHTRADFIRAVGLCRAAGLPLSPTFVTFMPWTTLAGYADLLSLLAELDLVEQVAPIQYAIRLLIPAGSRLLELPAVRALVGPFDPQALCYPWIHPDPRLDRLHTAVLAAVKAGTLRRDGRRAIFEEVRALAQRAASGASPLAAPPARRAARGDPAQEPRMGAMGPAARQGWVPMPRLSEPWYC